MTKRVQEDGRPPSRPRTAAARRWSPRAKEMKTAIIHRRSGRLITRPVRATPSLTATGRVASALPLLVDTADEEDPRSPSRGPKDDREPRSPARTRRSAPSATPIGPASQPRSKIAWDDAERRTEREQVHQHRLNRDQEASGRRRAAAAESTKTTPMKSGSFDASTCAKSTCAAVTPPTKTIAWVELAIGGSHVAAQALDEARRFAKLSGDGRR